MIAKSVDQITEEDLQALKDNLVSEGKTIEYKQSVIIYLTKGDKPAKFVVAQTNLTSMCPMKFGHQ